MSRWLLVCPPVFTIEMLYHGRTTTEQQWKDQISKKEKAKNHLLSASTETSLTTVTSVHLQLTRCAIIPIICLIIPLRYIKA